jgi:hypothetical protein
MPQAPSWRHRNEANEKATFDRKTLANASRISSSEFAAWKVDRGQGFEARDEQADGGSRKTGNDQQIRKPSSVP